MKVEGDHILFETTGRHVYALCGRVSIDEKYRLHEASDDVFPSSMKEALTLPERIELANFMIARWRVFADTGR